MEEGGRSKQLLTAMVGIEKVRIGEQDGDSFRRKEEHLRAEEGEDVLRPRQGDREVR